MTERSSSLLPKKVTIIAFNHRLPPAKNEMSIRVTRNVYGHPIAVTRLQRIVHDRQPRDSPQIQ